MNTVSFLAIPAGIVPDQEAIVSGADRFTYAETFARVRRLAGALERLGVGHGARVEALRAALPRLRTLVGFEPASTRVPAFDALLAGATEREEEAEVDDDDTSILMFTSGTTSLPKGVMLRYGDFTAYVTANVELADGTP